MTFCIWSFAKMTEGETGDLALKQVKLTAACHSRTKEWKVRLGRSSRRWSYLVISLIQLNWRSLILPSHGILSCVQLWQTFEFLQGRKKLHDLSWRTRKRGEGGSFPSVARLGRRLRKRRIEEGTQRGRQSAEEREIEGGEEKVGNPLKYVLKPLCRAQTGNRRIHQPAPERRLCNQSFLLHPTAAWSDRRPIRKGGKDGGQREWEWSGREQFLWAKASAMTSCQARVPTEKAGSQRAGIVSEQQAPGAWWPQATAQLWQLIKINEATGWSLVMQSNAASTQMEFGCSRLLIRRRRADVWHADAEGPKCS